MKDSGMSYKRITKCLNNNAILSTQERGGGVIGNSVHSVLKKNIERQRKLKILDKEYEMVWSRMKIKYEIK